MRLTVLVPLIAGLALAGCNSGDSVEAENESVAAVAQKVAASEIKPRPGRWETSVELGKVEMAGVPSGAAEAMSPSGLSKPVATCLTPEAAEKMDGSQFRKASQDCTYDTFTMAGGKVDGVMTCKRGNHTQRVVMAGTYGPESYNLDMTTQLEIEPGKTMTTTQMNVTSRRAGECNGSELK